jgi:biopolymer transport protein ExbB
MSFNSILSTLGYAGIILVGLSLVSFFLVCKNGCYLYKIGRDFEKKIKFFETNEHNYHTLSSVTKGENPLIDIIVDAVTTHAHHSDDMRAEISFLFHRNFSVVMRDILWLRLISVIAPMFGFMGTLFGIIGIFKSIAASASNDLAVLLASGIWEALVTTIAGLCVAIPALIFYYAFSLVMKRFHIEAIEYSYHSLEKMKQAAHRGGEKV